jgi:hypothetical protein
MTKGCAMKKAMKKATKKALSIGMLALAAFVLTPARADAHAGWWDWIEGLSGPGPFSNGWVVDFRPYCFLRDPRAVQPTNGDPVQEQWTSAFSGTSEAKHCLVNSNQVRGYFEVRGGVISTAEDKGLFHDKPYELQGKAKAHHVQVAFMRQIDPMLAIGAGAGVIWFNGSNIDGTVSRFTFTPLSIAMSPLRLVNRSNRRLGFMLIRYEEVAIVGGMQASDFNAQSTSAFKIGNDAVRSISVTFDALTLFGREP